MGAKRLRALKLCGLAIAVMAVFGALQLAALELPWLRRVEVAALDVQIRLRGPQRPGPEIVIVMIDDRTTAELGQWPPPRRKLAQAVATLRQAGAKVIAIDVLFADPSPPAEIASDAAFAHAIAEAGNVVLPFTFAFGGRVVQAAPAAVARAAYANVSNSAAYRPLSLAPTAIVAPLQVFAERAALGHALVAFDVDGAPRYDYPAIAYDVDFYPSMAVRVAQLFLDVPWQDVRLDPGRGVALGRAYVPTDPGMRELVNYLGHAAAFPTYSLADLLNGAVADATFRDRIVLVGASAAGTLDAFASPFTAVMPGVERLATVIDSMLHDRHLRRAEAAPWLELAAMLAAALLLALVVSRFSLAIAFVVGVALVALLAAASQLALRRYGLWQASAVPIASLALTFIALSLYRYGLLDNERRHIRRAFRRYLAPEMVDRLVNEQRLPELGGEMRELTVLFSDLRGFTTLSEQLQPAELTRVVNAFLSSASETILGHGGTVDKYVGDCIMAFWNAPLDQADHAERACRAALQLVRELDDVNAKLASEGLPRLAAGIGINTGRCTVGNFGSPRRLEYSALGDAVNVASRLEGETKNAGFQILLGAATAARVPALATIPLGRVQLRGRVEPIEVHALVGDETVRGTAKFREQLARHGAAQAAEQPRATSLRP